MRRLSGKPVNRFVMALAFILLASRVLSAQTPAPLAVQKNVVYGMFAGLALLMDVHRPEKGNGLGVVAVVGTGFHSAMSYDAPQMKEESNRLGVFVKPLVAAGYTVFVINHRAAPHFRYPCRRRCGEGSSVCSR